MQRVFGFAEQGDTIVMTMGHQSTNVVQGSYPYATITVYLAGTTSLATLYSDNHTTPTPLANPFTADENGYWFFYAANGRYDVRISGVDIACPWTLGDVMLDDPSVTAGSEYNWTQNVTANNFSIVGANNLGARCVILDDSTGPISICANNRSAIVNGELVVSNKTPRTSGKGVEIGYDPASGWGGIENYNYDTGVYQPMYVQGSMVLINHPGAGGVSMPSPGYVGIGLDNPTSLLEVAGDIVVSNKTSRSSGKGVEIGYDPASTWGGMENYNYGTNTYEPIYIQGSMV